MSTFPRLLRLALFFGALLAAVAVVAACSPGGDQAAADPSISVSQATIDWPANPSIAAVRMVVTNTSNSPDALISVSTPVAARTQVHRSVVDDEGRSTMIPADELPIAARSSVTFGPNGLHVMLTGIAEDLQVGDKVELDLTFERMGVVSVTASVIEPGTAPDQGDEGNHGH